MCEKSDSESRNLDTPRKTCPGHVFGHVWAIQLPTHGMTFPKTNKKKKRCVSKKIEVRITQTSHRIREHQFMACSSN